MSDTPMLGRRQLRLAALAALQGASLGATIDCPGDWVTQPEKMPAVLLRAARGNKEPMLRGPQEYTSTVTLEIESRAAGANAAAAQDAIESLDYAIEQALFTNYELVGLVQQMNIDSETEITAEGRVHYGATKMTIRCEFCEVFDPVLDAPAPLQPVAVPLGGVNLHMDMLGTFDPNGTYPNPPFPASVTPAPRSLGPDGRDEGGLNINFPP